MKGNNSTIFPIHFKALNITNKRWDCTSKQSWSGQRTGSTPSGLEAYNETIRDPLSSEPKKLETQIASRQLLLTT